MLGDKETSMALPSTTDKEPASEQNTSGDP